MTTSLRICSLLMGGALCAACGPPDESSTPVAEPPTPVEAVVTAAESRVRTPEQYGVARFAEAVGMTVVERRRSASVSVWTSPELENIVTELGLEAIVVALARADTRRGGFLFVATAAGQELGWVSESRLAVADAGSAR